ncbi:MAG: response regulator transcription factor [Tannerella sp.]|jgi:DNA-binding response OmpR family regulator|nr:response regulator transcription factor [Tannerella sp.]
MAKIKILLVEDSLDLAGTVREGLTFMGSYDIQIAENGKEGYKMYKSFEPDIIVSDIAMPEMDGYEMVEKIRKEDTDIPIFLATGYSANEDKIKGYALGIDDYLTKPVVTGELHLRIQAVMRRIHRFAELKNSVSPTTYKLGNFLFDAKKHQLTINGMDKTLTVREAQILQFLYDRKGDLVSRDDIMNEFWGVNDYYTSRNLDVFITKLRKYLQDDPGVQIVTVRGVGLKLVC